LALFSYSEDKTIYSAQPIAASIVGIKL